MHATLEAIKSELTQLAETVRTGVPNNEPLSVAHGNWTFPGVTRDELLREPIQLIELIAARGGDAQAPNDALLLDYVRRLSFLKAHTIPQIWGNAAAGVPAYQITLAGLRNALSAAFAGTENSMSEQADAAAKRLKELLASLRAIETRLTSLGTRSSSLDSKIQAIERAHDAAEQLPTDLDTLAESRAAIGDLLSGSDKDRTAIKQMHDASEIVKAILDSRAAQAEAVLARCDEAYRVSTNEGLASAFSERAKKLTNSMWIWVVGLVLALVLGAIYGSSQLQELVKVVKTPGQQLQDAEIWIKILLTVLSVAGPVWFAWISTKQIGQRFRLAEDYGYKASISKAYEGYRREAALLDPEFQARLFSSALSRLDEVPLRLVETVTHGSPWQELASTPSVRDALNKIPNFAAKVTALAEESVKSLAVNKVPTGAAKPNS
jgi:hypothetical protein